MGPDSMENCVRIKWKAPKLVLLLKLLQISEIGAGEMSS